MTRKRDRKKQDEPAVPPSPAENRDDFSRLVTIHHEVDLAEYMVILDLLKREPRPLPWFRNQMPDLPD